MNELNNTAVFIDYENIYKSLLYEYKNLLRLGFFEKLRVWCKRNNNRIVKTVAYCNFDNQDLYESYHQSKLHEYGIQTVHTSNRGKNYADIQLTIDVLDLMYLNDNIDEFIIVSNDKDMSPLINTIKANKRKVTLITANDKYDPLLNYVPDEILSIKDIINEKVDGKLKIEIDENEIFNIFLDFSQKNFDDYVNRSNPNEKYKHIDYDYTVGLYTHRFHIPRYEIANIIHLQIRNGKIILYQYLYRSAIKYGIISAEIFDKLIIEHIIEDSSKININTIDLTQIEYDKYIK